MTTSPGRSTASCTFTPLTEMPLRLLRSRTTSESGRQTNSAWRRDSSGSASLMSQRVSRPTVIVPTRRRSRSPRWSRTSNRLLISKRLTRERGPRSVVPVPTVSSSDAEPARPRASASLSVASAVAGASIPSAAAAAARSASASASPGISASAADAASCARWNRPSLTDMRAATTRNHADRLSRRASRARDRASLIRLASRPAVRTPCRLSERRLLPPALPTDRPPCTTAAGADAASGARAGGRTAAARSASARRQRATPSSAAAADGHAASAASNCSHARAWSPMASSASPASSAWLAVLSADRSSSRDARTRSSSRRISVVTACRNDKVPSTASPRPARIGCRSQQRRPGRPVPAGRPIRGARPGGPFRRRAPGWPRRAPAPPRRGEGCRTRTAA